MQCADAACRRRGFLRVICEWLIHCWLQTRTTIGKCKFRVNFDSSRKRNWKDTLSWRVLASTSHDTEMETCALILARARMISISRLAFVLLCQEMSNLKGFLACARGPAILYPIDHSSNMPGWKRDTHTTHPMLQGSLFPPTDTFRPRWIGPLNTAQDFPPHPTFSEQASHSCQVDHSISRLPLIQLVPNPALRVPFPSPDALNLYTEQNPSN